jgi:hypothetical protein
MSPKEHMTKWAIASGTEKMCTVSGNKFLSLQCHRGSPDDSRKFSSRVQLTVFVVGNKNRKEDTTYRMLATIIVRKSRDRSLLNVAKQETWPEANVLKACVSVFAVSECLSHYETFCRHINNTNRAFTHKYQSES